MDDKPSHWPQVVLIYLLGVFAVAVISIAAPALGGIAREFHPRSAVAIGWVMSVPALVAVLGALLVGWVVDTLGDHRILLVGGLILVVGDLGVINSQDLATLLIFRVASGLGYVCMAVATVTMMTRLTQGRVRTAALALWSTVIPASFIVAFGGASLLPVETHWRIAFIGHAVLTALLLLLGLFFLKGRAKGEEVVSRSAGIGQVLRSFWPYVLGLSFAANAFLQTGVVAALPQMLAHSIGASEARVHSFNSLAMLFNVLGALGVGALLNRGVSATTIGLSGAALSGLACFGLALIPSSFAQAMVMSSVFMFGCGALMGMWALLPLVSPSMRALGATSGLITQITLAGVLFGPPAALLSLTHEATGFLVFVVLALMISLAGLPVWIRASHTPAIPRPSRLAPHHG